jgi:hypothetical protein
MDKYFEKLTKKRYTFEEKSIIVKKKNIAYKHSVNNQIEIKTVAVAVQEYIKEEFSKLKG